MRRWTLTAFLTAAAGFAAFVAPTLVGVGPAGPGLVQVPVIAPPVVIEADCETPEVVDAPMVSKPPRPPVRMPLVRPATPTPTPKKPVNPPSQLIPEIDLPITAPPPRPAKPAPAPVPQDFWPDMIDCGMG